MKSFIFTALFLAIATGCKPPKKCFEPEEGKKYLIAKPVGGLANRLRVIASAAVMAKASSRTLVLDWELDPNMGAKWNELFENPIMDISELKQSTQCKDNRHYDGDSMHAVEQKLPEILNDSTPNVHVETCFNFYPASLSFDEYLSQYKDFYRSLVPIAPISTEIGAKSVGFNQKNSHIGVHYRAWQTSVDADFKRAAAPLDAFEDMIKKVVSPEDTVYFASDNESAKKHFSKIGQHLILSKNSNMNRTSVESQQQALVDWYLLTKSRAIIGTKQSSFSEEAAHLTASGKKYNVGPTLEKFHSVICFDSNGDPYKKPLGQEC